MSTDLAIGTFAQVNEHGLIEVIDERTGAIISVQNMLRPGSDSLKEQQLSDGRKILVDEELDPNTLKVISRRTFIFTSQIASVICQLLTEGKGFPEICQMEGMPSFYVLQKWRQMYPDFDKAVEQSLRDKAYLFLDKALEQIHKVRTKDGDFDHKAISDTYIKLAEKTNPDRFGNKIKHSGSVEVPMQLIIETGVPQKLPDAEPIRILQNEAPATLEGKHD